MPGHNNSNGGNDVVRGCIMVRRRSLAIRLLIISLLALPGICNTERDSEAWLVVVLGPLRSLLQHESMNINGDDDD